MERTLEVRKLPPVALFQLVQILELGQAWKQLMAIIPKNESSDLPKYKVEHIRMIENAGEKLRRPCSEILLDEWGCSGRQRPTLGLLLNLLVYAGLFRAADYVATELLKEPPPTRPNEGPAALVDVSDEALEHLLPKVQVRMPCEEEKLSNTNNSNSDAILEDNSRNSQSNSVDNLEKPNLSTELPHFTYIQLQEATAGFSDEPYIKVQNLSENISRINHLATMASRICIKYSQWILPYVPSHFAGRRENPTINDNFNKNGRKLGTGAFGSVYLAYLSIEQQSGSRLTAAVKRLNKDAINLDLQFRNEVEMLSRFQHPNLIPLLGYSCDGPLYCLVYEYMSNGSLLEKLACKDDAAVLKWRQRLTIAQDIAKGIVYLHTALPQPLVHRDIKSANILLDGELTSKIGDFGLVRMGGSSFSGTTSFSRPGTQGQSSAMLTTTVLGTSAYMAPEAFRGDVSVKLDTFSYGVVILELLTSLPPYDSNREGCDLVTHIEEVCVEGKISPLLDSRAGSWGCDESAGQALFEMSMLCIEEKRKRPKMTDILTGLENIVSEHIMDQR